MRQNAAILDYCRTSMSALSGSTAGIIGLTGLYGFIFYFITAFMLSVSTKSGRRTCSLELGINRCEKKKTRVKLKSFAEMSHLRCVLQRRFTTTAHCFLIQIMLLFKAGSQWNKYFLNRRVFFTSGLFGGLFVSFHSKGKPEANLSAFILLENFQTRTFDSQAETSVFCSA